jgi:cobalt/nickel transport system permease protein
MENSFSSKKPEGTDRAGDSEETLFMTHMHIPDGLLPVWLWLPGLFFMLIALGFSIFRIKSMDMKMKIPLLGTLSAAMLVVMSIEIAPLAYHINLSVVTGILLGPSLGFVAAFITNFVLALIGHGGITVIGLNTLLLGSEAVLGHVFFTLLGTRVPLFWRAAVSTVFALLITTGLLIGIVAVANMDPHSFLEVHDEHKGGVSAGPISLTRFTLITMGFGALGWAMEAAITGSAVRFIATVKPDLIRHALHAGLSGKKERKDP